MNRILIISFFVVSFFCLSAKEIDKLTAQKAANNFINKISNSNKTIELKKEFYTSKNSVAFYVFDLRDNGFVIISANDNAKPILAYSLENNFSYSGNPSLNYFLTSFNSYVEDIINSKSTNEINNNEWNKLLTNTYTSTKDGIVGPLLLTKWDQNIYYNDLCPVDERGPGGHVYAGCVATAMAQVMKYYNFPKNGVGSSSYYNNTYGALSCNHANTTYLWENMPLMVKNDNLAVATLLSHLGISVNMNYGYDGSGSDEEYAIDAIIDHFKYNGTLVKRNNYTSEDWAILLKTEIDNSRPIFYVGYNADWAGHAFNLDGYNGDYFHVNFGWSGSGDGYYYIEGTSTPVIDYNRYNSAIINFYPDSTKEAYPYLCSQDTIKINNCIGSISDNSGPSNYNNNLNCVWNINVGCGNSMNLLFDSFDVDSTDTLFVYSGDKNNNELTAKLTGKQTNLSLTINNTNAILNFVTDDTLNSKGWNLSYVTGKFCKSITVLTDSTGVFEDGSSDCNYNNLTNCVWRIEPTEANMIILYFEEFNTEANGDYLKVYNSSGASNVLLANLSGDTIPDPIIIEGNKAFLRFTANSDISYSGFKINYVVSDVGINEQNKLNNILVYPIPANDYVNIMSVNEIEENAVINLFNTMGVLVKSDNFDLKYKNKQTINLQNLPDGIYYLQIKSNSGILNKKIIKGS